MFASRAPYSLPCFRLCFSGFPFSLVAFSFVLFLFRNPALGFLPQVRLSDFLLQTRLKLSETRDTGRPSPKILLFRLMLKSWYAASKPSRGISGGYKLELLCPLPVSAGGTRPLQPPREAHIHQRSESVSVREEVGKCLS
jgi:hypothetical protein